MLPTYFLFGLYNVWIHNQYGHPGSLLGMQSDLGWWYTYFPVVFALKTTLLPFFILSLAALIWAGFRLFVRHDGRFFFLLVPFALFTAGCMAGHINIGIRHYLPAFPFLLIAGGALLDRLLAPDAIGWASHAAPPLPHSADAACWLPGQQRLPQLLSSPRWAWIVVKAACAFPHYIPYTNQLTYRRPELALRIGFERRVGRRRAGARRLSGRRGETRVRAATLGGWMTLRLLGVDYVNLAVPPGTRLPPTLLCRARRRLPQRLGGARGRSRAVDRAVRRLSRPSRRRQFSGIRSICTGRNDRHACRRLCQRTKHEQYCPRTLFLICQWRT